ncbi:hypothetical protein ACJJIF_05865 [Microbulbifer sp. SSSA002]|uniref:hypothetical protein n=1 Tax=unclassified Microbulbifer TaxID=2619833 RepID=UPI004039E0E9
MELIPCSPGQGDMFTGETMQAIDQIGQKLRSGFCVSVWAFYKVKGWVIVGYASPETLRSHPAKGRNKKALKNQGFLYE